MARKRKMKKEQEIFVGGLDRDAMQVDIKKAFEKIEKVVELWLNKDFVTNKNKGFAFVTFSNKEQAAKALLELKNPIIRFYFYFSSINLVFIFFKSSNNLNIFQISSKLYLDLRFDLT